MKMGIGIGWPNSTSGTSIIYTFIIQDCNVSLKTVYSVSSEFLPGAFMFENVELTTPFSNLGFWNLPELIGTIGGYTMAGTGEVENTLTGCPT
jgi:hypothetical protein